jgi:hypothetical protein
VENGYYYDAINIAVQGTSLNGNVGSSGCYTSVQAATTWGVTVDASTQSHTGYNGSLRIGVESYIEVYGIKFAGDPLNTVGNGPIGVDGADHIKLIKNGRIQCSLH